FVWLGVVPGLALVRLFLPGAGALTRWTLGLALAPLAATAAGWALVSAGHPLQTAARLVAMGGWFLFAGGEARGFTARPASDNECPSDRMHVAWAVLAAAFVAAPMLLSEWARVRSDSWVHAGIVWEIAERGLPPQDPRFAGLPLNYVWFYNLFIALLVELRPGSSPFTYMATANACWAATLVLLTAQLAWSTWRDRAATRSALPLILTGLNAGALFLWPLWFLRAAQGDVQGMPEVRRILAEARWDTVDVMHQLCAPFAWMVNAWDKYMVGTALGYAYLLMLVSLWAGLRWLTDAREGAAAAPWRWLAVAGTSAAGMMLFHSVVGLSAVPVGIGACLLLALLTPAVPALGPARRLLWLAVALAAGLACTYPYFRSISAGWDTALSGVQHRYLHLDWRMPWTLLTACGFTVWLARPALMRVVRRPALGPGWLAAWTLGMTLFALVVALPLGNEHKFTWMVFVPLALFAAPELTGQLGRWQRRLGPLLAGVLTFVTLVMPSLLLLRGFLLDPARATAVETFRAAGEPQLYAWIRQHTPTNAVFVDDDSRDVLLVEGRRRLLVGTPFGPDKAAFPADMLAHRRDLSAALYGHGTALPFAAAAAALDSLGGPAYVLYRPQHAAGATWAALDSAGTGFERVYADSLGHRIYRRSPR
ncbi:MAG: hypothetical protein ABL977_10190, partial [Candidatus Eisenbacteria bacterium]